MKKTLGKGSVSLLLVVLALMWSCNLPVLNGKCFGDIVLNSLGLPTWSHGTSGLHITIFWSLFLLIPAFFVGNRNKTDLFAKSGMWISGLFCAGMMVIGAAILISTGNSEAGSYQAFYRTVQDQAMAKVNNYDFKGHPYITIEQDNMGEQMLMTIDTEAGTQTQYLSEIQVEYLWGERIPSLYYSDISGQATFAEGKYTLNGHININCSPAVQTPDVSFESFILVTELNGKEISKEDITSEVLNYEAYPNGVYWYDTYQMECEAVEGDELGIYLEATDSLGYLHRMLLHHWKVSNGATAEAVDGSEYIYDPNGVQIFP